MAKLLVKQSITVTHSGIRLIQSGKRWFIESGFGILTLTNFAKGSE
jgi:hypothetical protein